MITSKQAIKVGFIGYGNIAKAIIKGISNNACYHLSASSPSLTVGIDTNGVATHNDNVAIVSHADIVVLCVKPDKMRKVITEISPVVSKHCALLSVAAGLRLSWFEKYTSLHQPIVRGMPNIATAVQKGATPFIANAWVSEQQKEAIAELFAGSGLITWLSQEEEIDIFTALSGSGPAYVFLFLEAMTKAAKTLGLSQEVASKFALQTVIGACELVKEEPHSFDAWRQKVTSLGGTTAAAIQVLQEQYFDKTISNAIEAAYKRAIELSSD